MNILLAEDDRMIIDIYQKKLEIEKHSVEVATGGKEVLKKVRGGKFDLILLDLVFPEIGGMELLRQIKKENYSPGAKVVIFSNLNEEENQEEAVRLGADGFIHKSQFTPEETLEEIKKIMKQ
ncbi:MAG: response regulator [Candidatus Moranbacteria bacterium]|jgi:CheY-like chemotaxis protein|nr:response regulator [Candidatus Moranbacteria bacterium]